MIDSLRRQRDAEIDAHRQTRWMAEQRILSLETQLTRRESELERCIGHTGECFNRDRGPNGDPVPSTSMSPEKIHEIERFSSVKNKALEVEIKRLSREVSLICLSRIISQFDEMNPARVGSPSGARARPVSGPTTETPEIRFIWSTFSCRSFNNSHSTTCFAVTFSCTHCLRRTRATCSRRR